MLPTGVMSEEAQELANKIYREVRECHTRKNKALMLIWSDLIISKIGSSEIKTQKKEMPGEIFTLNLVNNDGTSSDESVTSKETDGSQKYV